MSFDCSRFRFDPEHDYFGVVMQQGRVQLDADWNEWIAQVARRLQAGTLDALGPAAVPWETPNGFRIQIADGSLTIGPGRLYVDGILAENHGREPRVWNPRLAEREGTGVVAYGTQPYLPNPPELPRSEGLHLVYLDVWRRDLTWLQAPALVEKAVGVDTTGRWQTVWQVKVLEAPGGGVCVAADPTLSDWTDATRPSAGRLSTDTGPPPVTTNPCQIPPAAGFKGLENQLYRVEIHQGGAPGTATFKWSRDNATVATPVTAILALDRLIVESLGRDDLLRFRAGDWVEVTDDWRELHNLPGELRRILPGGGVDDATRTVRLATPLPESAFPVNAEGQTDPLRHTRLRRWDQDGTVFREDGSPVQDLTLPDSTGEITVPADATRLFLEDGILVDLHLDQASEGGVFKSGDYWVFAARSGDGSVELLDSIPPLGIHHHYAPLALVRWPKQVIDQRRPLLPASSHVQVCSVLHLDPDGRPKPLQAGQELPLDRLEEGVEVLIRQAVEADSVTEASLFMTAEIPFRLPAAYSGGPNGPVVAYQPVVLPAEVRLSSSGALDLRPFSQTVRFLGDFLKRDEARLSNVRFESSFQVVDYAGAASKWALGAGNLLVQTEPLAGLPAAGGVPSLPTTAIHCDPLKDAPVYIGVSVDWPSYGTVGLVYNWLNDKNFSMYYASKFGESYGFSGGSDVVQVSHARLLDGEIDPRSVRDKRLSQSGAIGVSLDIKQTSQQLQFGASLVFFGGGSSNFQEVGFDGLAEKLLPGSRVGVLTAAIGSARFTRLQVVYGDRPMATLVPAGLSNKLLARLVLKRSLLQVTQAKGVARGGVFAPTVPAVDYETWFWLTPPSPSYYGYGGGLGVRGIGSGRLGEEPHQ
ncbi:hypothetical protein KQ313_11945 [Synechococcus sp. CS-1325]|uniref:DUF6519 domain-containing protein n=1 Tax=Synechococcus sp. CS-1325 TaxID=2847979 RepID=UPI000DB744F5|nr:DUF6519 domain-containing protein [Synechococcus sp. CS-1325]MCT0200388.1 hypothetical protein [Synechococcus sp. CS-1325]PZU96883.1 MAG: hypothetical protein DCF24_13360 [Cyanobium sp.]